VHVAERSSIHCIAGDSAATILSWGQPSWWYRIPARAVEEEQGETGSSNVLRNPAGAEEKRASCGSVYTFRLLSLPLKNIRECGESDQGAGALQSEGNSGGQEESSRRPQPPAYLVNSPFIILV